MTNSRTITAGFLVSLCLVCSVFGVKFEDCGSVTGKVASVSVVGCADDADTCVLKRGSLAQFGIVFKDLQVASAVEAKVHGIIAGVEIPFPLPQQDACQKSGLVCPLVSGKMYSYSTSISVLESYPPLSVGVKWELQDSSNSKDIVCIQIKAKLE